MKHNNTACVMKINLIILCFIFVSSNCYSQSDTVRFTSEKVGLVVLTHNIDSIKYFPEKQPPNPFGPSMEYYNERISSIDTTYLSVIVKDKDLNIIVVYIWNKILPGAYKFYWWNNLQYLPSGCIILKQKQLAKPQQIKSQL